MDFLKTLMLYMSLTFATSVQNAPVPQETPVPTATPAAIVEQVQDVEMTPVVITAVPTVTPYDPNVTPTPEPKPTITPNKAYTNLQMNSRGADVKKLQERLIELGYLTGEADGAFGRQTYRAVVAFQKANGLGADGIAGDATQTILFESPDVIPNPDQPTAAPEVTPSPKPSVSPEPEALPEMEAVPVPEAAAEATAEPTAEPTQAPAALTQLTGASIVLNGSGEKLTCLRQEDGVTIRVLPQVWQTAEGGLLLDMTDLAGSVEDWTLTPSAEGAYTFSAAGYAVTILPGTPAACQVDGADVALAEGDFLLSNGAALCSPALLEKTLSAQTLWDADEQTLMLQVQHKDVAQATD